MDEWPRHIAARIARMKTLKERRAALEKVPDHLRDWVKTYLEQIWKRKP